MHELKKQKLISKGWSISNNPFEFLDDISNVNRTCEQRRFWFIKNQIEYLQDELRDLYWKNIVESITNDHYIDMLYNIDDDCVSDDMNEIISLFDGKFQDRYLRILETYDNDGCVTSWIEDDVELYILIEYSLVNEQILKNLIKYWLVDKKDRIDMIKLINKELKHQRIDL